MAVEYSYSALQVVGVGQNVLFNDSPIPCTKGYIIHRDGSGIITLRGVTNQARARYRISFGANIAVPASQTVGPISLAISIEGEPVEAATMIVTPAAVEQFFNVSADIFVDVPKCCCVSVAVENTSTIPVNVQNANIIIDRVA